MTIAWLLIDALGRRKLLVQGSIVLTASFLLLALFGGLAERSASLNLPVVIPGILGTIVLFVATGAFGIGWLATVWLVPTEIYPTTARAQGTAISVVVWGFANFAVTFLTPVMFNNLSYYIFLVFAGTNLFAGVWTWIYLPESGGRSFEDNQQYFIDAKEAGTWKVRKIGGGEYTVFKYPNPNGDDLVDSERVPLLQRLDDQIPRVE
jgi:MFS family permease